MFFNKELIADLNRTYRLTGVNHASDKIGRWLFHKAYEYLKLQYSLRGQSNSAPRRMPTQEGIEGRKKITRSAGEPPPPATQSTTLHRGDYGKKKKR